MSDTPQIFTTAVRAPVAPAPAPSPWPARLRALRGHAAAAARIAAMATAFLIPTALIFGLHKVIDTEPDRRLPPVVKIYTDRLGQ